jgi:penicillin amidase
VPRLLTALKRVPLTGQQIPARALLKHWDYAMTTGSAAATVWWTFWGDYLSAVFQPWWSAKGVPTGKDPGALSLSARQFTLGEVLEAWTIGDQRNPAFTPPGGPPRDAAQDMEAAFDDAVAHLRATLGADPAKWTWGRLHSREFPSVTGAAALAYGPRPAGGDPWTVDAADGGMVSTGGPSWRMIVHWTGAGPVVAEGIYPGGQSENPTSPWYANLVADWWDGKYLPMPPAGGQPRGPIRWELRP